ncbi:hypothetical protein R50073_40280 [Maricurvus nonylphenolicus]|uniref:hypothetical protein n=1 Tax=Maricurvus nonylphenolicus TaxID=1008307 RepID=UPI0036F23C7C
MAGNFKRGRGKPQTHIGRGVLESVKTDGPHNEWLGMPPYYMHYLSVDGEEYSYLSGDEDLGIEIGKKVTFRYRETKKGKAIDKRSLGVVIDPSDLGL